MFTCCTTSSITWAWYSMLIYLFYSQTLSLVSTYSTDGEIIKLKQNIGCLISRLSTLYCTGATRLKAPVLWHNKPFTFGLTRTETIHYTLICGQMSLANQILQNYSHHAGDEKWKVFCSCHRPGFTNFLLESSSSSGMKQLFQRIGPKKHAGQITVLVTLCLINPMAYIKLLINSVCTLKARSGLRVPTVSQRVLKCRAAQKEAEAGRRCRKDILHTLLMKQQ